MRLCRLQLFLALGSAAFPMQQRLCRSGLAASSFQRGLAAFTLTAALPHRPCRLESIAFATLLLKFLLIVFVA